jgi:hypothetical protein
MNDNGHPLSNWREIRAVALAVFGVFFFAVAVGLGAWLAQAQMCR